MNEQDLFLTLERLTITLLEARESLSPTEPKKLTEADVAYAVGLLGGAINMIRPESSLPIDLPPEATPKPLSLRDLGKKLLP